LNLRSYTTTKESLRELRKESSKPLFDFLIVKDLPPKIVKSLEDFWKKVTERKDLFGKVDANNPLLWYILWKADFDILVMSKNFDLFQLEVNTLNGREALSEAHSHMSQWFSIFWDQTHTGYIDWQDFTNGWIRATQGGDNEVCSLLFNSIDRDRDRYISCKDLIEYCRMALSRVQSISLLSIEKTVEAIFYHMNRGGPFDVINLQEFIQYTQQNPDSLFGIWTRVLQWKKSVPPPPPPPPVILPSQPIVDNTPTRNSSKRNRKEIIRSKTTGPHSKANGKKTDSPEKALNDPETKTIKICPHDQEIGDQITLLEDNSEESEP